MGQFSTFKRFIVSVVFIFLFQGYLFSGEIIQLENLDYKNSALKSIRQDINKSIYTIKSRRPESNLPDLKFYKYKMRAGDNFWNVLSKCALDMDTLMSVNDLSSPAQVGPGSTVFIPNMRGVIVAGNNLVALKNVMVSEKIDIRYILKVNNIKNVTKMFLFVPCGKVTKIERSLFLGSAFLKPIKKGILTSGFGTRRNPFDARKSEFHRGVDIGCPMNTDIFAARAGRVVFAGYQGGYGKVVVIEHEYGYRTYYGHLSRILVKKDDPINSLQLIGKSGNTGRSTGPHLHFEIRKNGRSLNPRSFVVFNHHH